MLKFLVGSVPKLLLHLRGLGSWFALSCCASDASLGWIGNGAAAPDIPIPQPNCDAHNQAEESTAELCQEDCVVCVCWCVLKEGAWLT